MTQHKGLLWTTCASTASSLRSCHEFLGICCGGAGRAKVFSHYCFRRGSVSVYQFKIQQQHSPQPNPIIASLCLHLQGLRQIWVGAEGRGMRMARIMWLLVALGSQWPSEGIFGNGCYPLASCVSSFHLHRFLCPTSAGFQSQLVRS